MASVAKFKLNEAPRLLAHCSRSQKNAGSHIHQYRSAMNFKMAKDRHQGVGDYQFVKDTINKDDVKLYKRDDVKVVCSWAVTMPRELCHEEVGVDGEEFYVPNDSRECEEFFQHAYDFFKQKHGESNIISAYVHMDENVPHMHFTFVPIVDNKEQARDGKKYKVCAKEALQDCYGAKFQIELQDYISSKMGKELNMVKKDTVDYESNVKELKKKTLNERCAYLARQISRSEEELARKERVLKTLEKSEKAKENIDNIKTSTSNGYTIISNADWLLVKPLIKSIAAMKTERAELIKMLKEFENTTTAKENQDLRSQAEQLAKENQVLEKELEKVKQFMEETEVGSGLTVMDLYTMNREAEIEKMRQDNRDFSGYYADRE